MINPETKRMKPRKVDVDGESYRCARAYMIRLEPRDLAEPARLGRLAEAANMAPEQFRQRFARGGHGCARVTPIGSRDRKGAVCAKPLPYGRGYRSTGATKTEAPPRWDASGNLCLGGGCRSHKGSCDRRGAEPPAGG